VKGRVYGGVVRFPPHPKADMHGLVRIVIRTKSFGAVMLALRSYRIEIGAQFINFGIWSESASTIEKMLTAEHYGEVFVCALNEAYLSIEKYERIPKGMKNG